MTQVAGVMVLNVGRVPECCQGLLKQTSGFEFRLDNAEVALEALPGEEWRKVDLTGNPDERAIQELEIQVYGQDESPRHCRTESPLRSALDWGASQWADLVPIWCTKTMD